MDKVRKLPDSDQISPRPTAPGGSLRAETPDQSRPELSKDAVLTTSLDGMILGCNTGLSRHGYGPEELVGTNLADLFSADDRSVLTKLVFPAVREKGRCEATLHGRTRKGEEFSIHLCVSLLRDANSAPAGMVAVASEITEHKLPSSGRGSPRADAP